MNSMYVSRSGFTLIEILVVIAIIGLLSSVVLASINSTRGKARVAQMQASMTASQKTAILCMNAGSALATPAAGTPICALESAYPALPGLGTWSYGATSGTPCYNAAGASAATDLTTTDGTFLFCISGDGRTISCHESGCRTN